MLTLRKNEVRDKYSGEVIGEITRDTRRDLRAKIHRAFNAKEAVRRTSFAERAELGRRVGRLLTIHRKEAGRADGPRRRAAAQVRAVGDRARHGHGHEPRSAPRAARAARSSRRPPAATSSIASRTAWSA